MSDGKKTTPPSAGTGASPAFAPPVVSCAAPPPGPIQNGLSEADFKKECQNCQKVADDDMAWDKKMQDEYRKAAADPANKTGADIEKALKKSLAAQGITTSVAGTTDTSGTVKVKKMKGPCARVKEAATEAHENQHKKYQQDLEAKYGKGTAEFNKHWNDAKEWAQDEVNAYGAGTQFWKDFKKECSTMCP